MDNDKNPCFRLAGRPTDYARLSIDPISIVQFEDGQRIGTEKGSYEWWYVDAHLDNGATVVVVFYTKPNVSPNGPLAPRITISLTLPDGRNFEKLLDTKPELFGASKSGHLYFGTEGREKLFAWLPSVPYGLANVRYTIGAEEHRVSGSGYHDHNWGDVSMQTLMHNWYWARASVGPYTVIASYITATAAYGHETQIVYMLAKDGKIIADDDAKVSFETDRITIDGKTGKPVADVTRYTYHDADTRYVVSFEREKTILQAIFTDRMPLLKRIAARLIGFDGAYHRFTGKVTIEKFEGEARIETFEGHAIWELMYFGKARPHAEGTRCRYPTAGIKAAGQSA
jgi:hypothetical protein